MSITIPMSYKKVAPHAKDPFYATKNSACFDMFAFFDDKEDYTVINPGETQIISTGLIFDIPETYRMLVFARSGLSIKGMRLANGVGVIDADYKHPVGAIIYNSANHPIIIKQGSAICQGSIEQSYQAEGIQIKEDTRNGGFGSTIKGSDAEENMKKVGGSDK